MADPGDSGDQAGVVEIPDFNLAEACASSAIHEILDSCAQHLHKTYIEKKAFPYAADRVCDLLMSELRLSFVRHDRGEDPELQLRLPQDPPEEWSLETEPAPSAIDSWARSCVPIRKKFVRSKDHTATHRRTLKGVPKSAASPDGDARNPGTRGQVISLTEDRYEDEEEIWMREMKEKEMKRKRDDEARIRRKAAEEAEEEAKLLKVKGDMQNKPYAYDTDGNIIWVTPLAVEKLPNPTPSLNFKFKGGTTGAQKDVAPPGSAGRGSPKRRGSKGKGKGARKEMGFTDGFQRLTSQQPPMIDAMQMAAGVVLQERGRQKKGERLDADSKKTMSRKDYHGMVFEERLEADSKKKVGEVSMTVESTVPEPQDLTFGTPTAGQSQALSAEKPAGGEDWSVPAVAPPPGFVPQRPAAPPPALHNPRARSQAIGYRRGERDRVPTSGAPAAGFRNYFPPPPVGATMGHGLLPKSPAEREREFFFPDEEIPDQDKDHIHDLDISAPLTSKRVIEVESPRALKMGGSIQAPNRDLLKRLFR